MQSTSIRDNPERNIKKYATRFEKLDWSSALNIVATRLKDLELSLASFLLPNLPSNNYDILKSTS